MTVKEFARIGGGVITFLCSSSEGSLNFFLSFFPPPDKESMLDCPR